MFHCKPLKAGINWKDDRLPQINEARVGLARGGTRAALGMSAVVVLSLLPRCVEKTPEHRGYGTPVYLRYQRGGKPPYTLEAAAEET